MVVFRLGYKQLIFLNNAELQFPFCLNEQGVPHTETRTYMSKSRGKEPL